MPVEAGSDKSGVTATETQHVNVRHVAGPTNSSERLLLLIIAITIAIELLSIIAIIIAIER